MGDDRSVGHCIRSRLAEATGDDQRLTWTRARQLRESRKTRGPCRHRRHRAARGARLSHSQLHLTDLQQAQRRIWRLARRAHALPLEIAQAVRAAMPQGMPLGARITGNDWVQGGLTPDDAVAFARAMKDAGVDFVCVSSGGISADARPSLVANTNVQFAEKVKREAGIATRTVGLMPRPNRPRQSSPRARPTWSRSHAPCWTIPIGVGAPRMCSARRWSAQPVPARLAQGVGRSGVPG